MTTLGNKCKKIFYVIFTPVLLLLPELVFAAQETYVTAQKMLIRGVPPIKSDLSVGLLRQIFGTVTGSGLVGASSTILGQMFNAFNSGVLLVASIFLVYTTVKSVLELAQHTEAMGRKFSWWQPIRIALGVGILVPQATGYSFLNAVVMWITLQGVGLADLVWSNAVDYLSKGGVIYTSPTATGSPATATSALDISLIDPNYQDDIRRGKGGTGAILRSLVCMHSLEKIVNKYNANQQKKLTEDAAAGVPHVPARGSREFTLLMQQYVPINFTPSYDDNSYVAYFPGENYPPVATPAVIKKGHCGAYSWGEVLACKPVRPGLCDNHPEQAYRDAKKNGLMQEIKGLDSVAANAVNGEIKQTDNGSKITFNNNFDTAASSGLISSAADYQAIVHQMRLFAVTDYGGIAGQDSIDYNKLIADGWIAAGRSYFDLVKLQKSLIDTQAYRIYTSGAMPPPIGVYDPTTKEFACSGANCKNIATIIDKYSSDSKSDQTELYKRLKWVDVMVGDDTSGAIQVAKALNDAAEKSAVTGPQALPEDLKQFIKEGKFNIHFTSIDTSASGVATYAVLAALAGTTSIGLTIFALAEPTFGVADFMLIPLNKALNVIAQVWAVNLGALAKSNLPSGYNIEPAPDPTNSPFIKLQSIGNAMMYKSISVWSDILDTLEIISKVYIGISSLNLIASTIAAVTTFMGIGIGLEQVLQNAMSYVQLLVKMMVEMPMGMALPIIFLATSILFTMGVTLSYYVPLIPFMLFTFGVIGWLSFVIEAMVAAPIIALGITHPEGPHDLLGRAETGVSMLLSLFIRPAAMIFGLIAALLMSYVALDVLNLSFGAIVHSAFFSYSPTSAGEQIRNGLVLLIYTYIVLAIMNQCFSLVVLVPGKILHWIGISTESGQELVGQLGKVEQGIHEAAGAIGRGAEGIQRGAPSMPAPHAVKFKRKKVDQIGGEATKK